MHIFRVPGLKGEALFLDHLVFFVVSADCSLVQIRVYKLVLYKPVHMKSYKKMNIQINVYEFVYKFVHTKSYKQGFIY
jgi:hypothetical protein